jgi:putative ABC transport system substrate-binding protein
VLRDLIPGIKTIAILMNSTSPANKVEVAAAEQAARTLGWQVRVLSSSGKGDFDAAFQPLTRERADALLVCTDPIFESQRDQIIALAAHHVVPAIYALREYPASGGLMSYGASITDLYRQAGVYVGRILKGERPADLPVMQASKFELVLNLKTARALGLNISDNFLTLADEVIE